MVGQHRSTQRLAPPPIPDNEARLREFSKRRPRWGWRRAATEARKAGWQVNNKRIRRLWRDEGVRVPTKKRKKRFMSPPQQGVTKVCPGTRPSGCPTSPTRNPKPVRPSAHPSSPRNDGASTQVPGAPAATSREPRRRAPATPGLRPGPPRHSREHSLADPTLHRYADLAPRAGYRRRSSCALVLRVRYRISEAAASAAAPA